MPTTHRSFRHFFKRALEADPKRLHFAAHSHHPWPDASFAAHTEAWEDAARLLDGKWDKILGEVLPEVQQRIAKEIGLSQPANIAFAPNTHEFFNRILSCLPSDRPVRILSSGSEFHSFTRQASRWLEDGRIELTSVSTRPFDSFEQRFREAAREPCDLVWISHVFFDSGFVFESVFDLAREMPSSTYFVVDGYHGFMALPTDLGAVEDRIFYTSGGYKYAMSGEGVCFLACPDGYAERPANTGWFASFGDLADGDAAQVRYAKDGYRMFGSTFDPSGLYRMRGVLRFLESEQIGIEQVHAHVRRLQDGFLERLSTEDLGLSLDALVPGRDANDRGHFLTFQCADAGSRHRALTERGVITDYRGDRWRFGFGIYQDESDVDALCERLRG